MMPDPWSTYKRPSANEGQTTTGAPPETSSCVPANKGTKGFRETRSRSATRDVDMRSTVDEALDFHVKATGKDGTQKRQELMNMRPGDQRRSLEHWKTRAEEEERFQRTAALLGWCSDCFWLELCMCVCWREDWPGELHSRHVHSNCVDFCAESDVWGPVAKMQMKLGALSVLVKRHTKGSIGRQPIDVGFLLVDSPQERYLPLAERGRREGGEQLFTFTVGDETVLDKTECVISSTKQMWSRLLSWTLTSEFDQNLSNRLKVNEFAALSTSEFVSRYTGKKPNNVLSGLESQSIW